MGRQKSVNPIICPHECEVAKKRISKLYVALDRISIRIIVFLPRKRISPSPGWLKKNLKRSYVGFPLIIITLRREKNVSAFLKSCEGYFYFLNFFSHTANMWNFETDVIKRDAHLSLLRCNFLGYRESKEEGKGDQGCRKIVVKSWKNTANLGHITTLAIFNSKFK